MTNPTARNNNHDYEEDDERKRNKESETCGNIDEEDNAIRH